MNKRYETAKKQGLNWQALLLEDVQSEIKVLIQNAVLARKPFFEINKAVTNVVKRVVEELESLSLKQSAGAILLQFASKIYNYVKQTYNGLDIISVMALLAVSEDRASTEQVRVVNELAGGGGLDIKFGDAVYNRGVPLNMFAKDYMKFVKERIDRLSKFEAKEDYTSRVNLRNIAEMQIRQEAHEKEIEDLKARGVNLVWIVPHANCSERCEPWQGKLYSLDGTYGKIDGYDYQPLENATDLYQTTKSGKVYKNGCISGFNCRHTLQPYVKGNKPIEIPAEVIERQRAIDQKQRYLERGVREWKERALLNKGIDKKAYKQARTKAEQWNERYIEFSKKNKVAFYPSRTEVI